MLMKNIIILVIFTITSIIGYGQPLGGAPQGHERGEKHSGVSRQEIESQKIAYFTQELDLTPEEAQKFWPIYNKQNDERRIARRETLNSLNELNNALDSSTTISDTKIDALVNAYLNRYKIESDLFDKHYKEIKKILPLKKAAKVFNAEEKFRVLLVRQLRGPEDMR